MNFGIIFGVKNKMFWVAIVVVTATSGTLFTVPTVYESYEQCMHHAHKIENHRRWTLNTPAITVECVETDV